MTPETATYLIEDALHAVLEAPALAAGWQRLHDIAHLLGPSDAVAAARARSFALLLTDPTARFLRADCWLSLDRRPQLAVLRDIAATLLQPPRAPALRLQAFGQRAWAQFLGQRGSLSDLKTWADALQLGAQQYAIAATLPAVRLRIPDQLRRVVVVASHLGPADHAPTALALHHARLWLEQGCEVQLVSPLDGHFPDAERYLGCAGSAHAPGLDTAHWGQILPASVHTEIGLQLASPLGRWRAVLGTIERMDPDLVLVVGFLSPGAWRLAAARPTLGLNIHALAPLYPTDAWLAGDGALRDPWQQVPPAHAIDYPWRVAAPVVQAPRARADLGVPGDALLVVTPAIRLHQEATPEWAAAVLTRLAATPGARWLLIAAQDPRPAWMAHPLIHHLPYDADLPAVLTACDLMLNPPRLGGGISVALAMAVGLPVIAHAGSDGGDKLGADAVPDEAAAFALLDQLLTSADTRKALGARLRLRFAARLDLAHAGAPLMAAGEIALACFKQRVSAAS